MSNELISTQAEFTKEDKKQAVKTFSRTHISLVVYLFVAGLVISLIQYAILFMYGENKLIELMEGPYFIWILQIVSMYLVAFPLFLLMLRKLPKAEREKSNMSLKEFGYIFLVSEAIMFVGSIFSQWLVSVFESYMGTTIGNTTSDLIMETPLWLIILVVVIIGPIVEELIFRKAMIDRLSVYGDRIAVVASAFAFGLFHGNFHQLFYATALGLVLGYVYTKTRRSIYNILLHMAVNFMGSVPAVLLTDSLNRLNALPEDAVIEGQVALDLMLVNAYSQIQLGLAIAGIITLIVATFKRSYRFSDECDIKVPFINRFRVYFFNFGTLTFLAYSILQCIMSLFIM